MKNVLVILLSVCFFSMQAQKLNIEKSKSYIQEGKIVIKLKDGFSFLSATNSRTDDKLVQLPERYAVQPAFKRSSQNASRIDSKSRIDISSYYYVEFDKSERVNSVLDNIRKNNGVEYAEPLYMYETHYTPNDPDVTNQPYLEVINAYDAWDVTKGSVDVVVAVIDAGVDYEHDDLKNKIYVNADETPDNGIDDDNDGYIDNYYGWDFAGSDFENIIQDNDPIAKSGNIAHGTWVAGCLAAETDNGEGIAGVGFNTSYMALKCSADNDERSNGRGFILNSLEAVIYAAENGADVINMSYGGPGFSQFAQDVMEYAAIEHDVVLIASAGNAGTDELNYPAAYDYVVSVAATEDNDRKAGFSQYGEWVDISAPGVQILTTSPNQAFSNVDGTSFSGPIVAGAAGLLRAHYPDYNQFQIRGILLASGDDISAINTAFVGLLGKRLNIANAFNTVTPFFSLENLAISNQDSGIPLAGEQATIDLTFLNQLNTSSGNTYVVFDNQQNTDITLSEDTIQLGAISDSVNIALDLSIPADVAFNLFLGYNATLIDPDNDLEQNFRFSFIVNPLITEKKTAPYLLANGGDFESNSGDFRSAQIAGGIDIWELGAPTGNLSTVNSGENVWKTDLDGNLPNSSFISALQSPVFDMSEEGNYILSFYKSMETQYCNAPAAVRVEFSTDGGLSWERLGTYADPRAVNWYNKDPNAVQCPMFEGLFADREGWLGSYDNEYTEYNISNLSGNSEVVFRFVISVVGDTSDDGYLDGFMLDDFQIEKSEATAQFSPETRVAYTGQPISFDYLSAGASSYSWEFGDGGTSSAQSPVYSYTTPGKYTVSLTVENTSGSDTRSIDLYVLPNVSANFTVEDGGDLETNQEYFAADNIKGTGFELGNSSVSGKDGTASGDFAWVTGLAADQYEDESEAYLYTPSFDFSLIGTYTFNFSSKFIFEDNWDGFIVEYSLDRGATWKKLREDDTSDDWYNQTSDPNSIFGAEVPIFSGNTDGSFAQFSTDVSQLSGHQSAIFRFKFLTDAATVDVGMALDDVFVTAPVEGPIEASFVSEGVTGCSGQEIEFKSTSTGTISSMIWDFGANAVPPNASGPGPHLVVYDEIGESIVTLTASNDTEDIVATTSVITADLHTPSLEQVGLNTDGSIELKASDGDDFRWYLENELIEGANQQTYIATERGQYSAEISVGGCYQFASRVINVVTGLDNVIPFDIYPNPVTDRLRINTGSFKKGEISINIFNLEGKTVMSIKEENIGSELILPVNELQKGIYVMIISDAENNYGAKMIKE